MQDPSSLNLRPLVGLLAVAPLASCAQEDEGFRISSIAYDGDTIITLTFSQPIVDPANVNPADFRISFGRTVSVMYQGESYINTSYSDPIGGYSYNYGGSVPNVVSLSGSGRQLQIETYASLVGPCGYIEYYQQYFEYYTMIDPNAKFDAALFVHYAAGDIPIQSTSGSVLADIAADWVTLGDNYFERDTYGFLNPLRIPCPLN